MEFSEDRILGITPAFVFPGIDEYRDLSEDVV